MSISRERQRDLLVSQLPHGVFTCQDGDSVGVSVAQLRTLVAHGRLDRVAHGLYRVVQWTELAEADWIVARARQIGPRAVVAHASAAVLWGLRTPYLPDEHARTLWTLRSREAFGAHRQPDVRILPAQFEPWHVTELHGVKVTTLARTTLDLARSCPFERALVVMDHALALGVTAVALIRIAQYMNGWPGSRVFRPAIAWADALSESALESIARGRTLASALPPPTLQHGLVGASGATYRGDLVWPENGVVLELDGREKLDLGSVALIREKQREDDIRAASWQVVRMMYEDIYDVEQVRWRQLAGLLGVGLAPYNPEFGMKPRWVTGRPTTR